MLGRIESVSIPLGGFLSPHPEEPGDALAEAGVSKDEGGHSVFVAILRDAILRIAPQDEVGV
jgi:hypothetical protein